MPHQPNDALQSGEGPLGASSQAPSLAHHAKPVPSISACSQPAAAGGARASASAPRITSIDEELEATLRKVDIQDWDYKDVPRDRIEEEEE